MPGLLRGLARTAMVAGTATAVSNRVSRRQAGRWDAEEALTHQLRPAAPVRPAAAVRAAASVRAAPRGRVPGRPRPAPPARRSQEPGRPDRAGVRGPEATDPRTRLSCHSGVTGGAPVVPEHNARPPDT